MKLSDRFEVAGGSVIGRDHILYNKPNQDAYYYEIRDNIIAGVVCDGCGSTPFSQVGASLASKMIIKTILDIYKKNPKEKMILENCKNKLIDNLLTIAKEISHNYLLAIRDYFLFTIVGFIVINNKYSIFTIGDGVFCINGNSTILTAEGNAPPYISYNFYDRKYFEEEFIKLFSGFTIQAESSIDEIESLLVGTDGVTDILQNKEYVIPIKQEKIGDLSQFWTNDYLFKKTNALNKRLQIINQSGELIDWENKKIEYLNGCLRDDTTMIVLRKKRTDSTLT